MGMLDEGAGDLDSLAFANRVEALGATVGAGASLDGSNAYPVSYTHLDVYKRQVVALGAAGAQGEQALRGNRGQCRLQ